MRTKWARWTGRIQWLDSKRSFQVPPLRVALPAALMAPIVLAFSLQGNVAPQTFVVALIVSLALAVVGPGGDTSREDVRSQRLLEAGLKASGVGVWRRYLETGVFVSSQEFLELIDRQQQPPRSIEDFMAVVVPDDRALLLDACNECVITSGGFNATFRIKRLDGSVRWIETRGTIERDAEGAPISVVGSAWDVTSLKNKEFLRASNETFYEKIAESIPGVLYQMVRFEDGSRIVPYISENVEDVFGFTRHQVYRDANLLLEAVHPEDREKKEIQATQSRQNLTLFDWTGRIIRPDGSVRWIHAVSNPNAYPGGGIVWDTVVLDVTEIKEAEAEHIRTKDRLAWILQSSPVVIYSCSPAEPNPITFLSENSDDLLGIPFRECLQDSFYWQARIHPDDQELAARAMREVLEGASRRIEYRFRVKSGEYRWLRDEMRFVDRADGGAVVGTVVDVTERKLAQEKLHLSEERFRAMSHASPLGIFMTGDDGEIVYANERMTSITERPEGSLLGKRFLEGVHEEDRERALASLEASLAERTPLALQFRLERPNKPPIWCSVKTAPMEIEGRHVGFVGTLEDVTDRFELEMQSEQARIAAEQANQAKSTFLSRISHELRTPLHAMLGFAQLLESSKLDASQRESVDNILSSGKHLRTLIRDVLDIARAESGELGVIVEPVSLYPVIDESVQMMKALADEKAISVSLNVSGADQVTVLADRQRIRQVFINLLSNAIKYNKVEGSVRVSCDVRPDGFVTVSMADSGYGITADKLDRLFTPFDRLGAEASEIEGTGLGLTLTRRLVEAMGGSLQVESDERTGTTAMVTLRHVGSRQGASAVVSMPVRESEAVYGDKKILLVEDRESNILLMETLFRSRPEYALHVETTGKRGLEWALENRPDLILLDMNLPDIAGSRILERIKREPSLAGVGTIVISATAEESKIERTKQLGAVAYLTKPLDLGELMSVVDEALRTSAQ